VYTCEEGDARETPPLSVFEEMAWPQQMKIQLDLYISLIDI